MNDKTLTAEQVASIIGGQLKGNKSNPVKAVASLKDKACGRAVISFLGNKRYEQLLKESPAGTVIVGPDYQGEPENDRAFILCENPDAAFAKAIGIFAPDPVAFAPGVHPSAVVAEEAVIGQNVHVGANAVIESGAAVGDGTVVGAGVYVGHESKIGDDTLVYPNVTIRERCVIGSRVIIHPGVVIGGDGFGFLPTPKGILKLPQTGIVQIDDDVEIGSNTTIDRARFGKTWIKRGTKIDNLCMIAHNAVVGDSSILIAQCGLAGSAELGRGVVVGAQGGVNGHITLGDGVKVAATSAVAKSVPPGVTVAGTPAERQRELMERLTLPKRMRKLVERINALEERLQQLES